MHKDQILRKNWQFQRIVTSNKQIVNRYLIIYFVENSDHLRVGISVSKKFLIAVKRNFIRRQIRKILTEAKEFHQLKFDIVLIVRKPFIKEKFDEKRQIVNKSLVKLSNKAITNEKKQI